MKRLLLGVGAFALLGGCFQEGEQFARLAPPSLPPGAVPLRAGPPEEIFPLQPGARFDYQARFGLGAGQFAGSAEVSVVRAWRVGDRTLAEVGVTSRYLGRTRHDPYLFCREAGWIGMFEKDPPDRLTRFLPVHLGAGDRWPVATGEGTGEALLEAREDVATPAGRFKACYRVRYRNTARSTDMTFWFAPRLGLVKADIHVQVGVLPLVGTLALAHADAPLDRPRPGELPGVY